MLVTDICKSPVCDYPLSTVLIYICVLNSTSFTGYAEAAVKLQRDWKVEPESLPFAKHVEGPALVNLVQKGLRYHHLSLQLKQV